MENPFFIPPKETRLVQLKREIASIENNYPPDDFILSYEDFLKNRDLLPCYQFNPIVLENLVKLTNKLWESNERISRTSLCEMIKRYYKCNTNPTKALPYSTAHELFTLFRNTYDRDQFVTPKQREEIKNHLNSCVKDNGAGEMHEQWLCDNAFRTPMLLNRLLRYPKKSEVIEKWNMENYRHPKLITRRAELVGWRLDADPNYEISKNELYQDFEETNTKDIEAIKKYLLELEAKQAIEKELGDYLNNGYLSSYNPDEERLDYNRAFDNNHTSLMVSKRYYQIPRTKISPFEIEIPDFRAIRIKYQQNIAIFQKNTMIWGITYSRLDYETKFRLYQKYYSLETYNTLYKCARRIKHLKTFQWLLEQEK